MKCKKLVIETGGLSYSTSVKVDGKMLDMVQRIEFKTDIEKPYIKVLILQAVLLGDEIVRRPITLEFDIPPEEIVDNKTFGRCKNCNKDYCQECSHFVGWEDFCCPECKKEYYKNIQEKK